MNGSLFCIPNPDLSHISQQCYSITIQNLPNQDHVQFSLLYRRESSPLIREALLDTTFEELSRTILNHAQIDQPVIPSEDYLAYPKEEA